MNELREVFEGNYETKTQNKFMNTKLYLAASVTGCLFCLTSFILALINQKTVGCVIFLIALLGCMNGVINYIKQKA